MIGFFIGIWITGFTQKNYRVTYRRNDGLSTVNINGIRQTHIFPDWFLLFNDSLSFFHGVSEKMHKQLKKLDENTRLHYYATYYEAASGSLYSGALLWIKRNYKKYLIADSIEERKWITWGSTKNILGYSCSPFMSVDASNDTLLVWCAPQIPVPFGPGIYLEFSGLVLEVYDQRNRVKWQATKIEESPDGPSIPKDAVTISRKEFTKLRR